MAYTPTILYASNTPSTGGDVLYTVPGSTTTILKNIVMANTTGSEARINISVVPSGGSYQSSNRILSNYGVPANGTSTLDCSIVMPEGATIQANNITNGAVVVTISGVEVA